MLSKEAWAGIGSALVSILGFFSMAMHHERITIWLNKVKPLLSPYIQVTIPEYGAEHLERSDFYAAIQAYLSKHCTKRVRKLKAEFGSDMKEPIFYVDDGQEIMDTFRPRGGGGSATVWWHGYEQRPIVANVVIHQQPGPVQEEVRFYRVSFHRRFRESVLEEYLPRVIQEGRDIMASKRQRRLFTNDPHSGWIDVPFQHPATFDKLAMDHAKKREILDDLDAFKKRKEYYAKVGKPWKRGYLLFGPPGTGKSTMVSAMANHLDYDVYDLELTAVKSNNDLRRLFINTAGKSIIVIEDIDRSVDLTTGGRRGDKKKKKKKIIVNNMPPAVMLDDDDDKQDDGSQKLTLSGLLNFIDGLWSACGGERIIVFTTNNKDKLDPALIRQGRMDMHIEMSYCTYEAFTVLANNYLEIDEHQLYEKYGEIQRLLGEAKVSPAEVAEHLMRTEDADACLEALVQTLKKKLAEASKKQGEDEEED